MKYYLDCEFNGFGGSLISFALVREDGEFLSLVFGCDDPIDWVKEHVMPFLHSGKVSHDELTIPKSSAADMIFNFMKGDSNPAIICDWVEDIKHFCELVITKPGTMVNIRNLSFHIVNVLTYPNNIPGCVQHNAYYDALALKEAC